MDKAQLREQLLGTFLEELEERIRALNDGLLALEKEQSLDARTELLKTLFRSAHTLKDGFGGV